MELSSTLSSGNLAFGTTGMHAERCIESQSIIAFVPLECMYSAREAGRGELIAVLVRRPSIVLDARVERNIGVQIVE